MFSLVKCTSVQMYWHYLTLWISWTAIWKRLLVHSVCSWCEVGFRCNVMKPVSTSEIHICLTTRISSEAARLLNSKNFMIEWTPIWQSSAYLMKNCRWMNWRFRITEITVAKCRAHTLCMYIKGRPKQCILASRFSVCRQCALPMDTRPIWKYTLGGREVYEASKPFRILRCQWNDWH